MVGNAEAAELASGGTAGRLTSSQRSELLRIARAAIGEHLADGFTDDAAPADPALCQLRAAFVTLRREGRLRGCMGSLTARLPLYMQVGRSAVMAASVDPRFHRVTPEELDGLEIEISALGPLEPVTDVEEIVVGSHGLLIESGDRRGTLLPQVPVEADWSRDEFLRQLCRKAGLPPSAWQTARLYRYTAEVFSE